MRFFTPKPLNFTKILLISAALTGCSTGSQQAVIPRITPPDPAPIPGHKPEFFGFAPATAEARSDYSVTSGTTTLGRANSEVGSRVVAVELAPLVPQASMVQSATISSQLPVPGAASSKSAPQATQVASLTTGASTTGERTYVVRLGDTLYGIARQEQLSVHTLAGQNNLNPPYDLQVGQRLKIPGREIQGGKSYVVAKGDTLYGIARRHGVTLAELEQVNQLKGGSTISPGQRLMLPQGIAAVGTTAVASLSDSLPVAPKPTAAPAQKVKPVSAPAQSTQATKAVQRSKPVVAETNSNLAAALSSPPPRAGSRFLWPVKGRVILGYGPKSDGRQNDGINIAAARGTPVRAAENGVIAYTGNELRGFGNLVLVKHGDGWTTAYAHVDQIMVRRGDKVVRGQIIGLVGSTGSVSSPQLHFEVRKGTDAMNPMPLLARQTAALSP